MSFCSSAITKGRVNEDDKLKRKKEKEHSFILKKKKEKKKRKEKKRKESRTLIKCWVLRIREECLCKKLDLKKQVGYHCPSMKIGISSLNINTQNKMKKRERAPTPHPPHRGPISLTILFSKLNSLTHGPTTPYLITPIINIFFSLSVCLVA